MLFYTFLVNPYHSLPHLYSDEMLKAYCGQPIGKLAPHVYAIAENAYRSMLSVCIQLVSIYNRHNSHNHFPHEKGYGCLSSGALLCVVSHRAYTFYRKTKARAF